MARKPPFSFDEAAQNTVERYEPHCHAERTVAASAPLQERGPNALKTAERYHSTNGLFAERISEQVRGFNERLAEARNVHASERIASSSGSEQRLAEQKKISKPAQAYEHRGLVLQTASSKSNKTGTPAERQASGRRHSLTRR